MPGEHLTRHDLEPRRVQLDSMISRYLPCGRPWPTESVVVQRIVGGEFVPKSSLSSAQENARRAVTIRARYAQGEALKRGTYAQVWISRPEPKSQGGYGKASLLLPEVLIGSLSPSPSHRSWDEERDIEVYLPAGAVPNVIDEMNAQSRLTLVPSGGGLAS